MFRLGLRGSVCFSAIFNSLSGRSICSSRVMSAMMPGSIIFTTSSGESVVYNDACNDISENNFVKVQVETGHWILYQEVDYNGAKPGSEGIMIVKSGDHPKDLTYSPKSIWEAPINDAATLFAYANYGGTRKIYEKCGCPDITADFPIATGVSSMINSPGENWELFKEKHYKPQPGKPAEPNWYKNIKEKFSSLRPHRPLN